MIWPLPVTDLANLPDDLPPSTSPHAGKRRVLQRTWQSQGAAGLEGKETEQEKPFTQHGAELLGEQADGLWFQQWAH